MQVYCVHGRLFACLSFCLCHCHLTSSLALLKSRMVYLSSASIPRFFLEKEAIRGMPFCLVILLVFRTECYFHLIMNKWLLCHISECDCTVLLPTSKSRVLTTSDMHLWKQDGKQLSGCFGIWELGSRWAPRVRQVRLLCYVSVLYDG